MRADGEIDGDEAPYGKGKIEDESDAYGDSSLTIASQSGWFIFRVLEKPSTI